MKTPAQINFRLLEREFGQALAVRRARGYFRRFSDRKLAWLLRQHDKRTITDNETYQRDDIDQLLDYLSMIEIGFVAGVFRQNDVFSSKFVKQTRELLTGQPLRQYYEDHYTLPLPISLKARLLGAPGFQGRGGDRELGACSSFLQIKRQCEFDPELNSFLWLLDGGSTHDEEEWEWQDLLSLSKKPAKFMEMAVATLNEPPEEQDAITLGRACLGVRKYLDFAVALVTLLDSLKELPELRLAFWQNYAYWLNDEDTPEYRSDLRGLLLRLTSWPTGRGEARRQAAVAARYKAALDALFDFDGRLP